MTKRLAIFAGYDKDRIIDEYVVYYLKELKKVSDIIFVYDNDFSDLEIKKIKNFTIHQIYKKHGEYDFGSYKRGYLWAEKNNLLEKYNSLILCNDSVFGPFYPLEPLFEKFEKNKKVDFWGTFFHKQKNENHIQSYFLVLKNNVFKSPIFKKFILNVKKEDTKGDIIQKYEIGLSQVLMKNNFKCKGLFFDICNRTHSSEIFNMISHGFPFLKRKIFDMRYQFINYSEFWQYKKIIATVSPNYPIKSIEDNVFRVFGEEELGVLRKFKMFRKHFLKMKIFKIKGKYLKNFKYKFTMAFLGITFFKIVIPKRLTLIPKDVFINKSKKINLKK